MYHISFQIFYNTKIKTNFLFITMTDNQISSPVKEIPDCWQDDKRMNVLFLPFKKREINPVDYDSKMKFWNNVIMQWCLENNRAILTLSNMKNSFKRKGRVPSCLDTVIEELLRNGDLKTKNDFLNTIPPETSWTGWAKNSIKTPFIWSFSKLKEALVEIDVNEVQYVYLGYLKEKSKSILSVERKSEKSLYTIDDLRKLIEPPDCTIETAELILHWLKLNGKATSCIIDNHELIKFTISTTADRNITDREIAEFKLIKSKKSLMQSVNVLEKEKEKALNEAKEYLSKGMRQAAKSSLRKKKALDECIIKRITTMDNLDLLITRMRDTHSDAEVFDSYKTGLAALKTTFKETGLTEDNVMDTMNDLEEINEMQDEIQNALAHQLQPNNDEDLEEELSSILTNAKLEEELKLPDVPSLDIEEEKIKIRKVEPIKFATVDS
ncbi:hypothetical protein O3M35_006202 [Rhynocoris fuscipes]|uniref:Charged multivesicular body protein 7 n=1 Tax=Rhynocoris fuscipes TaxID=488301 RepID=A0AAW1DJY5_9HEMI